MVDSLPEIVVRGGIQPFATVEVGCWWPPDDGRLVEMELRLAGGTGQLPLAARPEPAMIRQGHGCPGPFAAGAIGIEPKDALHLQDPVISSLVVRSCVMGRWGSYYGGGGSVRT
jgi:hypothetical protein